MPRPRRSIFQSSATLLKMHATDARHRCTPRATLLAGAGLSPASTVVPWPYPPGLIPLALGELDHSARGAG
jgi:hypothetical protein